MELSIDLKRQAGGGGLMSFGHAFFQWLAFVKKVPGREDSMEYQ